MGFTGLVLHIYFGAVDKISAGTLLTFIAYFWVCLLLKFPYGYRAQQVKHRLFLKLAAYRKGILM